MAEAITLDEKTIRLVDAVLKDAGEDISIDEAYRRLQEKMSREQLLRILDALVDRGRILFGGKGVLWAYMPKEEMDRMIARGRPLRSYL